MGHDLVTLECTACGCHIDWVYFEHVDWDKDHLCRSCQNKENLMADFKINTNPTAYGSLNGNQVRFELFVDTGKDVRLNIEDRNSMADGKSTIIGADDLRTFAEGILEYLKAVGAVSLDHEPDCASLPDEDEVFTPDLCDCSYGRPERTIAIAHLSNPTEVSLWCYPGREHKDGGQRFTVINGGWDGLLKPDGEIYVERGGYEPSGVKGIIVWEGCVPKPHDQDYNAAIRWIQSQIAEVKGE